MRRDSYPRIALELGAVLAVMAAVAAFGLRRAPETKPRPVAPVAVARSAATPRPVPVAPPEPASIPEPVPAPPPILDEAAIARAEADVEATANDLRRASRRLADASDALATAQTRAASALKAHRSLASTVRDPTPRLRAARVRGEALKGERDRIEKELMALNAAPRPRRKPLVDKSPVAKRSDGDEYHFEVRGDRVAFIDLERLLDRVKTDARVQLRLTNGLKPAAGSVGPVGSFSMAYEVARMDDGSNPRLGSFGLTGWEIVPESEHRGETFTAAMGPASAFSRAINRLNPSSDIVTMWIYPDGFPLYRQLRENLQARGFLVAARPLPEGSAIKGSPAGSSSMAQ